MTRRPLDRACTHGMPTPAACIDCMQDGPVMPPRPPAGEVTYGPSFEARYEGECRGCADPVFEGQRIRPATRGGFTLYVHEDCTL